MRAAIGLAIAVCLILAGNLSAEDFDGDSRDDIAVFRPSNGRWKIKGVTTIYFGTSEDTPLAMDLDGDGIADPAFYRESTNLWKVRNQTRLYFGNASLGDTPFTGGGGGQRTWDYVVKTGDGDDLVAALESDTYRSVFIPSGTYAVTSDIDISGVRYVSGAWMAATDGTIISLSSGNTISLNSSWITMENLTVLGGAAEDESQIYLTSNAYGCRLRNIRCSGSAGLGIEAHTDADGISLCGCEVVDAEGIGYYNLFEPSCSLSNCRAIACGEIGFYSCNNLSQCTVVGSTGSEFGFSTCSILSNCHSTKCDESGYYFCYGITGSISTGNAGYGFLDCDMVSACFASSNTSSGFDDCDRISSSKSVHNGTYGFDSCDYLSTCYANNNTTANWNNCTYTAACNDES